MFVRERERERERQTVERREREREREREGEKEFRGLRHQQLKLHYSPGKPSFHPMALSHTHTHTHLCKHVSRFAHTHPRTHTRTQSHAHSHTHTHTILSVFFIAASFPTLWCQSGLARRRGSLTEHHLRSPQEKLTV